MVLTVTSAGLAPYQGPFGQAEANHLLRRTTFGVTQARVNDAIDRGLSGSLDLLLTQTPEFGEPINGHFSEDPGVPIGSTWVRAPYVDGVDVNGYRSQSLRAFISKTLLRGGFSISSRMFLFWHNHFAAPNNLDKRGVYTYYKLLYDFNIGNFKELVTQMTIDPLMFKFLNGNLSRSGNPNENYARELLELYTIGKGEQIASGDYSTFTEDDIRAIANKLTGWQTRNMGSLDPALQPESYFTMNRHDATPRQLSYHFDNKVLSVVGEDAYKEVIDTVFEHPLAAHYICRKLYRWFVFYTIDSDAETNIIEPMAQALVANDFEIAPVIRLLLNSEHFFDLQHRGALIKNPIDYIADITFGLGLETESNLLQEHAFYLRLNNEATEQSLQFETPPSVAGFSAWHQSPQFNRIWINAATLSSKTELVGDITGRGIWYNGGDRLRPDFITYIEDFDNPTDPNDLIDELGLRIIGDPLTATQIDALKEILIPGLPDFEWTVEYGNHLNDPDDVDLRDAIGRKLDTVVSALLNSPEFHLF